MIYVYALTDPGDPPTAVRGLDGATLHVLAVDEAAAVYSELGGEAPGPSAENLWQHEAVAEALLPGRAVLPVRFGTTLEGAAHLNRLLQRNVHVVVAGLDRVRGLVEVGVRVVSSDGVGSSEEFKPTGPGSGDTVHTGREYLMHRLAGEQRRRARREQARRRADAVHQPLAALAQAADLRTLRQGDVLVGAYLVAPTDVDVLVARARELDDANPDLQVICTGPWPAHSFVPDLDLEGAAHS